MSPARRRTSQHNHPMTVILTPPNSTTLHPVLPVRTMDPSDPTADYEPPAYRQTATAIRRPESPPRNAQGDYICTHSDCQQPQITFRRVCEWNKHMDRHERPYKCEHPNCLNAQGFTYSGGLLRHQREVHRWHQTSKSRIFCPFPDCSRNSSGEGFSRRENLEEHKRRRHADQDTPNVANDENNHESASDHSRKRKRRHSTPLSTSSIQVATPHIRDHTDYSLPQPAADDQPQALIKRLRHELHQTQQELHQTQQELRRTKEELRTVTLQNGAFRNHMRYYSILQNMPTGIYPAGQTPGAGFQHEVGESRMHTVSAYGGFTTLNGGQVMGGGGGGGGGGAGYKKV